MIRCCPFLEVFNARPEDRPAPTHTHTLAAFISFFSHLHTQPTPTKLFYLWSWLDLLHLIGFDHIFIQFSSLLLFLTLVESANPFCSFLFLPIRLVTFIAHHSFISPFID